MFQGSQFGYNQPRSSHYGDAAYSQYDSLAAHHIEQPYGYRPSTAYVGVPAIFNETPQQVWQSSHTRGPVCDHYSYPQYSSYGGYDNYGGYGRSSYYPQQSSHSSYYPQQSSPSSYYPQQSNCPYGYARPHSSYYPSSDYVSVIDSTVAHQPRLSYRGF